jgi:hypothetical protein
VSRLYSIRFEIEDLFKRAAGVNLSGQQLRTLCDQDLMLVLCVHAAKHSWMQLSWLCDIAKLSESRALDWNALQQEAQRLGILRIVAVSFLLANQLLAAALPQPLKLSDDPAVNLLVQKILREIAANSEFDPESLRYFRRMMDLRERRRDRFSFLWRLWITPGSAEWTTMRLPGSLFPLYRVIRMFRLVRRMVFLSSKM